MGELYFTAKHTKENRENIWFGKSSEKQNKNLQTFEYLKYTKNLLLLLRLKRNIVNTYA